MVVAEAPASQRQNIRRADYETLDNASTKRPRTDPIKQKKYLGRGQGWKKFGGLLDRKLAMDDRKNGLECLALHRGNQALDKKEVPVLALSAPSTSGKTEFLKEVFNECCTFNPNPGKVAKEVLERINNASPSQTQKLDRLLVLFASFSQRSTLPLWSHKCQKPCFYYLRNSCEKGVEGVFRGGFGDLAIFFQMKLYQKVCATQIKNWLIEAHHRVQDLDYREGTYIVQLFVTGAINNNVEGHKKDWPEGSVVFADKAIGNLFSPFGKGVFSEMVKRRRRENRASK